MSKKLTSLMVIAAAGLLSLPVQAQNYVAKKAAKAGEPMLMAIQRPTFGKMPSENMLIKAVESEELKKSEYERLFSQNIRTNNVASGFKVAPNVDVLPYLNPISTKANFDDLAVFDANGDGSTWAFEEGKTPCAKYKYNKDNDADDWLATPGIKLKGGKRYILKFEARQASSYFPEKIEVKMAKADNPITAAALAAGTVVMPETGFEGREFAVFEKEIEAPSDGYYSFGIHAISEKNMFNIYVKNISVEAGLEANAPDSPTVEVTPADGGLLKAEIKMTAPTKDISGVNLTGNLSKLVLLRDGKEVWSKNDVAPGAVCTFNDETFPNDGDFKYIAIPYDADGNAGKKSEEVAVYVGVDKPKPCEWLKNVDNHTKINLTWSRVEEGVGGHFLDPTTVKYTVYKAAIASFMGISFPVIDDIENPIVQVTDKQAYEYDFDCDEGKQAFKFFGIRTESRGGVNESTTFSEPILVGKPEELPIIEHFENKGFNSVWFSDGVYGGLYLSRNASDGDGYALNFRLNPKAEQAGEGHLSSGKINLNPAGNPQLLFDVMTENSNSNLSIWGSKDGGEFTKIKDITLTNAYKKERLSLNDFKGGRFAQVRFVSNFADKNDSVIIDNIMIRDVRAKDLGVEMSNPETVKAGEKATITVTVENCGEQVCDNYKVDFYAGGKLIKTENVAEGLNSFDKKQITFDYKTTIFDEAGDVALKAVVTVEGDLKDENNVAESVITVKHSTSPSPTNLNGTEGQNGVTLTWQAPASTTEEKTEGFDDESVFVPFSIGGITKDVHIGTIGDWTLYDGNGMQVYGFQGASFPNSGAHQAWQVFNPDAVMENWTVMTPKSGKQYMISFCPADQNSTPEADHWLISPQLPGNAQTISFFSKQISTVDQTAQGYYGLEKFEVLSTTAATCTDVSTFTKVGDGQISNADWSEFTFNLPAGTTFFAIRHTSTDIFGLLVDDVKFSTGAGSIASYNIYVDGELYTNVDGNTLTAIVSGLSVGSHVFGVTAVYANGQESKPVTFVLETTSIDKLSVDGKPVDIYTVDGKLVRKQATTLEGLNGLYIINNQKVIIR